MKEQVVEFRKREPRTVQKTVRLPIEIDAALQVEADKVGISVPAAIVQILEAWAKLGRQSERVCAK